MLPPASGNSKDAPHGSRVNPTSSAPRTALLNPATISAAILAAAIFIIDLTTASGHGIAALYVLPLLVGTLNEPPRFQLAAAGIVSALTLLGAWLSPAALPFSYVVTNRTIAIVLIWATTVVLGRFRSTWIDLRSR